VSKFESDKEDVRSICSRHCGNHADSSFGSRDQIAGKRLFLFGNFSRRMDVQALEIQWPNRSVEKCGEESAKACCKYL
jgi:hypothetical protein